MTIDEAIAHAEEVMMENLEKTKDRNASDPIAIKCFECADEHRQLAEWLKDYKRLSVALDAIRKEIKEWYWQADKQAIAKDPCVVDSMVDLFIRTINKHINGGDMVEPQERSDKE